MSRQRQLNALLFELQSAQSPLEQAKAIARAWRTVRDLSPSDRRLLARHAGFKGAEQLLEGLTSGRGGPAPSLLLQTLSELREDDGQAVAGVVGSLSRRRGAPTEPTGNDVAEPVRPEGDEVRVAGGRVAGPGFGSGSSRTERGGGELPEDTMAALEALRQAGEDAATSVPADERPAVEETAGAPAVDDRGADRSTDEMAGGPDRSPAHPVPPGTPELLEAWRELTGGPGSAAGGVNDLRTERPSTAGLSLDIAAASGVGAERGGQVLERFRRLSRHLEQAEAGSAAERLQIVQGFPDGWQRRRAVVALLDAGAVSSPSEGLDLIATLGRQLDRRWCLRVLVEKANFGGAEADRAACLVPERPISGFLHLVQS